MRQSGILLAMASLPSRWGVGGMGDEADAFADFLEKTGQSLWQVLPLTIPDSVYSPYASLSAFAGNPLLLDPALLAEEGLLSARDVVPPLRHAAPRIDYTLADRTKTALFRRAFAAFRDAKESEDYRAFCRRESYWLPDFALFDALKAHYGGLPFPLWPKWDAREKVEEILSEEIRFRCFLQYQFDCQLRRLRKRLQSRGVRLIGDIPFYVAEDSADVWAHPDLFCLKGDRTPRLLAGVPPDFFSENGQLWGNPVYDWTRMREDGYRFWIRRLARCASMYDITRIDHFRALDSYYAVEAGAKNAVRGQWLPGPGMDFFDALRRALPDISMIAEDLGSLTPSVYALRRQAGLPGMRVLQFAFGSDADDPFLPHCYEANTVAYLGTHDNDTSAGWWQSLPEGERRRAAAYLDLAPDVPAATAVRRMMRVLSASVADTVIFTLQDLSAAGSRDRINTPSQIGGCWEYAAPENFADARDAAYLKEITILYGRGMRTCAKEESE